MDKSVEAIKHEMGTRAHGARVPEPARPRDGRLLRRASRRSSSSRNISACEARLLTVTPYDKSSIKAIEKAIMESDLGLTPSNDGNLIRLDDPRADRGAPQGPGQGRAQDRRGGPRVGPQRAPRREHDLRELKEAGETGSRRRAPRRGRAAEADRRARPRDRRPPAPPRKQEIPRSRRAASAPAWLRATSRSSWTATRAGRRERGLPVLEGHRAGREGAQADRPQRGEARARGADGLRVLDRELVAARATRSRA